MSCICPFKCKSNPVILKTFQPSEGKAYIYIYIHGPVVCVKLFLISVLGEYKWWKRPSKLKGSVREEKVLKDEFKKEESAY